MPIFFQSVGPDRSGPIRTDPDQFGRTNLTVRPNSFKFKTGPDKPMIDPNKFRTGPDPFKIAPITLLLIKSY